MRHCSCVNIQMAGAQGNSVTRWSPSQTFPLSKLSPASPVAPLDSRSLSLIERLMAALACCTPILNPGCYDCGNYCVIASCIVLAFTLVSFSEVRLIPLPLRVFNIFLALGALCGTRFAGFSQRWRWWAMGFCVAFVASFETTAVMNDANAMLGVVLLLLTLITWLRSFRGERDGREYSH